MVFPITQYPTGVTNDQIPFLLTSLILALSACTGKNDDNNILDPSDVDPILLQFETCSDTRDYIGDVVLNQILSYRYSYYGGLDMGFEDSGAESDSDGGNSSEPTDYTTTNNQEEGVDEIDW